LYVSFDDGDRWQPMQLNLPISPITDLAIRDGDLIAATQGRGYWILDDMTLLRQLDGQPFDQPMHLFTPRPAWRLPGGSADDPRHRGQNPPDGAVFLFHLDAEPAEDTDVVLQIEQMDGQVIRRFTRKPADPEAASKSADKTLSDDDRQLELEPGLNRFVWDLHYPGAETFEGLVLWNRRLAGPRAVPGSYRARLVVGDREQTAEFEVIADPRSRASDDDYQQQFDFMIGIRDQLTELHRSVRRIREVRQQVDAIAKRVEGNPRFEALLAAGDELKTAMEPIEKAIHQTQAESRQDPLNFPIRLNDKLSGVMGLAGFGDNPPTQSMREVRQELGRAADEQLNALSRVWETELDRYNELAREAELDAASPATD
jgi:hypothetical protein